MRLVTLGAVLVVGASACCVRCTPEQKSYVDVPAKLDEVKARARPPDVVVTVERRTERAGGGPCHSGACVILVPFLVWEAVFPDRYDEVSVTEGDVVTFHGLYTTSGDLLSARTKTDTGWRELMSLELPELGQRAIIERAKVTTLPDGGEARSPTTIQSQLDVITQYRAALAKVSGQKRGRLLAEALRRLDGEGDALVLERLSAADEPDESRAWVVEALCSGSSGEAASQKAQPFLDAAVAKDGPRTAKVVLQCPLASGPALTAAATHLTRALCTTKRALDARGLRPDSNMRHGPEVSAGVEQGLVGCPVAGVAVARLTLREPISTEAWLAAVATDDGALVVDLTDASERGLLFAGLGKRLQVEPITELLSRSSTPLTLAEATTLLDVAFDQPRTPSGWSVRGHVAAALRNARELTTQLTPRLAKTAEPDRRTAQAFLAMLGDVKARDALANDVKPGDVGAFSSSTEGEFVGRVLVDLGCDRHGLQTGKKSSACR